MNVNTMAKPFAGVTTFTQSCGLGTAPVPLEPYRSAAFFERERTQVFERAWLVAGRVEEIPNYGDYITVNLLPGNVPAIINRGKDGTVRAFYNTCSHRGSQVLDAGAGNAKRIVCPYHAWTYAADGDVVSIPDEPSFFNVDKKACGLSRMSVDVWEGWIFVNLQKQPEVGLQEFLGTFADRLAGVPYVAADRPIVLQADLDANWKVVQDAFIESYHIPAIHKKTIAETFSSDENKFARLLDARVFGPHRTVSMYGNPAMSIDPAHKVTMLAYASGDTGSLISAGTSAQMDAFLRHDAVNPTGSDCWSMDVNNIFPNTQIDFGPGGFWVHQFWPLTENTSRYEVKFYVPEPLTARQRLQQEMYVARVIEVVLEDLANVARTQRGIDSGGNDFMQIQDSEVGIRHSMDQLLKWVDAPSVTEALR
ncbi:aromatic ring-hydroxylating oxygenase subunit alpha [Novosphingobium colocasiae]|uniref:(2Fe-2S)-binding protein n=1 Tax=Novosphingobium colocasiae TaxID=1256513 RepID=A0A918P882_9SPHN|nr:aromatic ring-hydroxylating dioxygenase subunit alpha [Novosphingobium colocasiae]GGY90089.1 (2Fe-2S)-binding protein [Novosphingobium colocasiae]